MTTPGSDTKAHRVLSGVEPQSPPTGLGSRRSANYKPSMWNYDNILSLAADCKAETMEAEVENLKEVVRRKIVEETDFKSLLELVDVLQRLGLGYHFDKEIKEFLGSLSANDARNVFCADLYSTSLLFRLLREHGFNVSDDVFSSFKDDTGCFFDHLRDDIRGMLSLYEASSLSFEGEGTLDDAKNFTTEHLNYLKPYMTPHIRESVAHALELPLHYRSPRLEARWFIEQYERDVDADPLLLQLAKLDFNRVQSMHQSDLKRVARWWINEGLRENLSFARDRLVECFLFASGVVSDPHLGFSREELTKLGTLITSIDDLYDVYGSIDELQLFTDAIKRWESVPNNGLPESMKICYFSLYNITNEIASYCTWQEELELLQYLKKSWQDLCASFLVEAEWQSTSYTPSLEEYLNNGWMSVSGHVILLHALALSRKGVTMETLKWLMDYPRIIRSSSMIFRLCNDLATSTAELEIGGVPTAVQCYMQEYGVSEAEARCAIKDRIDEEWKKLNSDCMDRCPFAKNLANEALNLARIVHYTYQNGDGFGAPDKERHNEIVSMVFKPISLASEKDLLPSIP